MADPRFRSIGAAGGQEGALAARLDQPLRIVLEAGEATWQRQLILLCLVDLLGRLLPEIEVLCDAEIRADPRLPPGPELFTDRIEEARAHALIEPRDPSGVPDLTVVVGRGGEGDLYLDGSGWVGYLGESPSEELRADDANPIGPLVAACRGASQVIQGLLGDLLPTRTPVESSYWSALTLGRCCPQDAAEWPELSVLRVEALLMGAGSIGGAAAYALARVPGLGGRLAIVDFDRLEERNSRKALLARATDIAAHREKAIVAAKELAHLADLDPIPFEGTLADYVAARPAEEPLPLLLCAVDSVPARRQVADLMPLEVANAACGDADINLSGHRTDEGPCIYCLYIGDVLDAEKTREAMMVRELGLPAGIVRVLRLRHAGLEAQHLRQIEAHRGEVLRALDEFRGAQVEEIFDEYVLYGETKVADEEGNSSLLQLPFVPSLAGVLLAGEALKAGGGTELAPYRLGPGGLDTEYYESLLEAPVGMLSMHPRWAGSECLCRSQRRLGLMRERYRIA